MAEDWEFISAERKEKLKRKKKHKKVAAKRPPGEYLEDVFDESNIKGDKSDKRDNLESYKQLVF